MSWTSKRISKNECALWRDDARFACPSPPFQQQIAFAARRKQNNRHNKPITARRPRCNETHPAPLCALNQEPTDPLPTTQARVLSASGRCVCKWPFPWRQGGASHQQHRHEQIFLTTPSSRGSDAVPETSLLQHTAQMCVCVKRLLALPYPLRSRLCHLDLYWRLLLTPEALSYESPLFLAGVSRLRCVAKVLMERVGKASQEMSADDLHVRKSHLASASPPHKDTAPPK